MAKYQARLDRIEEAITPVQPFANHVMAFMDFDDRGNCVTLKIEGRTFTPNPGESEKELCERAKREMGRADYRLMLIQFIHAGPNGRARARV